MLYLNATYGKFVYDDFKIIVENCFIKEWKYFPKIFTKDYFTISGEMSYRPIVTISYFVDYAIWRLNPFGFHLTNVILHTLNAVLFYLLLNAVLQNKKIVLFSTLFFVTHLALVETINAVGYREDLLSATFLLVSLIYFVKSDNLLYRTNNQRGFTLFYAISLIAYLCALFSKEMAITFPVLLPLFTIFSGKKIWPGILKRFKGIYIGYITVSLFYIIIRFIVFRNHELKAAYQPGGFLVNTLTMIKILASYIKLSFFPFNLNADYVVPLVKTPLEGSFILSITFLISIFIIFAILTKLRNMFACWMAWFFIMILPVMNILPIGNIMAERYLYIPVMGFCVAKGILIYRITDRTLSPRAIPLRRMVQLVLVILMIGGYGFSIIWKNGDWRDELTLWTKTIQRSPNSQRAHCNLGNVYMESGLIEKAQMEYQTALELNPKNANVHFNLGLAYEKVGKATEAIREYITVIQLDPNSFNAHYALGTLYQGLGLTDKTIDEFQKIIMLYPNNMNVCKKLVFLYLDDKKDMGMSQYYLKELLKIDPTQVQKEDVKKLLERLELSAN
ncbi:MAG TPA: tetratricopeptide repeat protein [Candidatus Brocadiaceae bacterium]|nr:tetratricopeptide repeat protein [Candidatus Brocadiaceae bacterium]